MMRRGVFRGRLLIRGAIERSLSPYALEMDLWERLAALPPVASPPDARYAVLVPMYVDGDGTDRIIFTRRPEHMRTHPGDVVFPGGGREQGEDAIATAKREAWEEIRLPPENVAEVLGGLTPVTTRSRTTLIVPVVARIVRPDELVPDPAEVHSIIEPPVDVDSAPVAPNKLYIDTPLFEGEFLVSDLAGMNEVFEVDDAGLDKVDRAILEAIISKFSGGPVGLSTLAIAVGEEPETVEDAYEPYLLQEGFIQRTPRGRVATPHAYAHLGIPGPVSDAQGTLLP